MSQPQQQPTRDVHPTTALERYALGSGLEEALRIQQQIAPLVRQAQAAVQGSVSLVLDAHGIALTGTQSATIARGPDGPYIHISGEPATEPSEAELEAQAERDWEEAEKLDAERAPVAEEEGRDAAYLAELDAALRA